MADDPAPRVVVARESDERGEIALARRGDVVELIVDGVFAMDSVDASSERALAELALARLPGDGLRVLVGGLGLGYTVRALLDEPRVASVQVVELHEALVGWGRAGLVPTLAGLVGHPRLTVTIGDVLGVVPGLEPGGLEAVLLDVDNGPGFLIHPGNAEVYGAAFLRAAARALAPGGVLGVWSSDPAPQLADELARACGETESVTLAVMRDGQELTYTVLLASRPGRRLSAGRSASASGPHRRA